MVFAGLFSALVKQEAAAAVATNYSTIFSNVTEPSFYWDFRTTTPLSDATGDYVEEIVNGSTTSIKARAVGNLQFNSLLGPDMSDTNYIDIDDFKFGGGHSIEVYFYYTQFVNSGRVIDFASASGGGDNIMIRIKTASNPKLVLQYRVGATNAIQTVYESQVLSLNTWYHVVATVNSSGAIEGYLDSTDLGSNATINPTGTPPGVPDVTRIFNHVGDDAFFATGQALNGKCAFVRVWYGHVLSQAEVTSLYGNRTLIGNDKATVVLASNFDVTSVLSSWASDTSNSSFGASFTLTGETTYTFANGAYEISASDYNSTYGKKINEVLVDGGGSYSGFDWHSSELYDSNGNPTTTYSTTVDGVSYNGSWIQLSLPYKIKLSSVEITARNTNNQRDRFVKDALMAGSNDNGVTFETIDNFTTTYVNSGDNNQTQTVSTTKAYNIIRMVCKTTHGDGSINMEFWKFSGDVIQ